MKDCVIDELETWKQILKRFRFNCCSVLLKYSQTGQWITTKYLMRGNRSRLHRTVLSNKNYINILCSRLSLGRINFFSTMFFGYF